MENLELKFDGLLDVDYQGQKIQMKNPVIIAEMNDQSVPAFIKLSTELNRESISLLSSEFPQLKPEISGYNFAMKADKLQQFSIPFANARSYDDWMAVGNGACFKLENYDFVSSSGFMTLG